jgi:hypothetical protein
MERMLLGVCNLGASGHARVLLGFFGCRQAGPTTFHQAAGENRALGGW